MDLGIEDFYEKTKNPQKSDFVLHIHDKCEILYFLGGNASYFVDGSVYNLHKGDIIIMRSSEAHHLILHSNMTYERVVINFPIESVDNYCHNKNVYNMFYDRPIGKYNHYMNSLFTDRSIDHYIKRISETKEQNRKIIYLSALLDELADQFEKVKNIDENVKIDNTALIIQYIDSHLFENISIKSICDSFYISQPHLNRIFKGATGLTVWNYITTKRLMYAKELLKNGGNPTKIYEECGYQNYVSFYKAYVKAFGVSPSGK